MKILVEDIAGEGLDFRFSGEEDVLGPALAVVGLPEGVTVDPRIRGSVRVAPLEGEFLLVGNVTAAMTLQCSRCLEAYPVDATAALHLVLRKEERTVSGDIADDEEEDVVGFDGPEIDLGEIILTEVLLEVPMKPLCREDCPGLCQTCGALKGSPECTCMRKEAVDPRWAALVDLKVEPRR